MNKTDKELMMSWFAHIEQIATDKKTLNGVIMDDQQALKEIKVLAKDCQTFIKLYC